ncbi:MAG: hypothetical protein ACRDJH_00235 [Thermomicrobiales bacterium]
MAMRAHRRDDDALIERHVAEDLIAPDRARLTDSGVPIWALVAYLRAANDDPAAVAAEYEIPEEEMAAALAYYERHRAVFDARILLHHAAFA